MSSTKSCLLLYHYLLEENKDQMTGQKVHCVSIFHIKITKSLFSTHFVRSDRSFLHYHAPLEIPFDINAFFSLSSSMPQCLGSHFSINQIMSQIKEAISTTQRHNYYLGEYPGSEMSLFSIHVFWTSHKCQIELRKSKILSSMILLKDINDNHFLLKK